ncbi:MAG: hypothetical protein V2A61_06740, partial [Calditrichota bacterium]
MIFRIAIAFLLFAAVLPLRAEIYRVPEDIETIQAAVDSTQDGDTILVAEGEYQENITFDGKAIRITGDIGNPEAVVIDGGGNGSVVTFENNERAQSILEGFTLRNGHSDGNGGGGIYIENASPTLRDLIITGCTGNRGGGVLCWGGSPTLTRVVIAHNEAQAYGGGISLIEDAGPILRRVTILENRAVSNNGGGLDNRSRGRPQVFESIIRGNVCRFDGGGVFNQGTLILTAATIDSNQAERSGGGIFSSGTLLVSVSFIFANSAVQNGGGAYLSGASPSLERVVIGGNQATDNGGGLYLDGNPAGRCDPSLIRITLSLNAAGADGGAVFCIDNANPTVNSCILWNNDPQPVFFDPDGGDCSITVSYSDVADGQDGIAHNDNGRVTWGQGNISADPLFANPDENDFNLTWANFPDDDETKSPGIDAGHPGIAADPDGTRADMGGLIFIQAFPEIQISPESYDFGAMRIGQEDSVDFFIRNIGGSDLSLFSVGLVPPGGHFAILLGDEAREIAPGGQDTVRVLFAPQGLGFLQTLLSIRSNDPQHAQATARISGTGGNSPPIVTHHIPDFSLVEDDTNWVLLGDLDTVFADPDGDNLIYQIPRWREAIELDLEHGSILYFRLSLNFSERDIHAYINAVDEARNIVSDTFLIDIAPTNDLPAAFALLNPPDGTVLGGWRQGFNWTVAQQNQWETDTVRYTARFQAGEHSYEIPGLLVNMIPNWDLQELAQGLGIELGQAPVEVTWRVTAYDDSGFTDCVRPYTSTIPTDGVNDPGKYTIPKAFLLEPAFPNPFNAST